MKNHYSLITKFCQTFFATAILLLSNQLFAQVDVTATGGTNASYTTLGAAFDAINVGTHTGTISIGISGNTNEGIRRDSLVANGTGSANYSTITISPTGGAARTIIGNTTGGQAMIELQGADNVTIDGLNTGSNSLTIENTTISAVSGTSTIRFVGDATNNLITKCTINGAANMASTTNGGTIFFSTAASGGTGNDNNTISFCDLGPSQGNFPSKAIHGQGTTTAAANFNNNITITGCNIFDYFLIGATGSGILINTGNTDWTISNNRFYQTGVRTTSGTVATIVQCIQVLGTTFENLQITGNTFGFTNSSGTGLTSYATGGTSTIAFRVINLSLAATGTASSISNNTISGISMNTTIGASATTAACFAGVIISSGAANITSNNFGSLAGTNSISITDNSTATTVEVYGVYYTGTTNTDISNNNIGNITVANAGTGSIKLYGLRANSAATLTHTFNNNTIGSSSGPLTNTNAAATSLISGIQSNLAKVTITNNTLRNFTSAAANTNTTTTASIVAIYNSATAVAANCNISGNTIHSMTNTHISAATSVIGILNTGANPPTDPSVVSKNFIHSLTASSTAASITGIYVVGGAANYQNNMVRLGSSMGVAAKIWGIQETGTGTNNYYHNTVYIGNTGIGSTVSNTFAYQNASSTIGTRAVQNNIFFNARSNSTTGGKHYAVATAGGGPNPAGLTINYNIYRVTGTGGVLGLFNAVDQTSLGAWQTAVGQDANSLTSDPCLSNPEGLPAVVNLHLTNCLGAGSPAEGTGTAIGAVTDDFDGQTRATLTPTDIGADAGLYGPAGKDVGITALVRPTATSCHSAAEDVVVRLLAFSDPIDFSVDNVTINVSVTGTVTTTYTITLTTGTLSGGASIDVTMGQINTTANGSYTFASTTVMTSDVNSGNNANNTTFSISYSTLSTTATPNAYTICNGSSTIITSNTTGGTTPYSYSWSPGGATTANPTVSPTTNTTYTLTVTDACGVTASDTAQVAVVAPSVDATAPNSRCGTGTVLLGATPSAGATINWYTAPTGGSPVATATSSYTTPQISATTSYYVTANVTSPLVCESARTLVVATVTPPPVVNVAITPGTSVCKGETVQLSASSPTNDPNYAYSWSFNNFSTTAGTGASFSFVINQDSTVYFIAEDTTGASPNFGCKYIQSTLFTKRDSASTPIVSPSSASSCTPGTCQQLTVTNATTSGPATVDIGTATTTIGGNNGNPLRTSAAGGSHIQLLILASELTAGSLNAGNLTSIGFTTTGAAGTLANYTISIGHTSATVLTATYLTPAFTTVFSSALVTPVVGLNNFTFSTPFVWDGTSNIVVNICWDAGTIGTTTVSAYTPAYVSDCQNVATGACAIATGATVTTKPIIRIGGLTGVPASFLWNPGALTGSSVNVCPNATTTYTVTVTNGSNCTKSSSVVVKVSDVAYVSSSTQTVTCNGGSDGSITVNGTGTYGPLQYSINNGSSYQSSNVFSGLAAGNYNVRVKDALNCATTAVVVSVSQPTAITFTATPVNVTCYGASDGSITVSNEAGGNGGPFTYSNNNGTSYQASSTFTGLSAGSYQMRIKDASGCESAASATVVGTTPATQYTVTATSSAGGTISPAGSVSVDCGADQQFTMTPNACFKFDSVQVDGVTVSTSSPYTITGVMANHTIHAYFSIITYTVTATNGTGGTISNPGINTVNCGSNLSFMMTPDPGYIVDSVTVDGVNLGALLTYTFNNIIANHTIDVTFTQCTTPAEADAGPNSAVCAGLNHTLAGSIGGSASSGTWSSSGTGSFSPSNVFGVATTYIPSAADITAGSVIITLTTDNPSGPCPSASAAMLLTINPLPTVSISGLLGICPGGSTILTANASGTITGYQWSDGINNLGTTQTQSVSIPGTYFVTVTNNNGCINSTSTSVIDVDNPVVSISGTSPICAGTSTTISSSASVNNGTVSSYLWYLNGTSTGLTTPSVSVSQTGTYTVVATSSFGCTATSNSFVLSNGTGPLNGTYTINSTLPASCANFVSFNDALTALNVNGQSGNVIFDVNPGHTETAPSGGLKIDMCGLAPSLQSGSTQTLTIQKAGVGANPLITAQVGTGALDGIFEIVGGDYITIDGIDLQENGSNATATTRAEWGYALLKCSGTDGCNNNAIKHCTVTLNKANANSVGIYLNNHTPSATLPLTVTATSGQNSNNIITDNTVTNSYGGIIAVGFGDVAPYTFYDQGNQIGQTSHGNQVTNFGGGGTTTLGIYTAAQNNQKIIANTVNSQNAATQTGGIYGIYADYAAYSNTDIIGNTVTVGSAVGAPGQFIAIINNSGSRLGRPASNSINNIVNIKNNTVTNCTYGGSSTFNAYIYTSRAGADTMSAHDVIITDNTISNNTNSTSAASASSYGIISQSLVDTGSIANNTISGNTMNGNAAHGFRMIVTGFGGFGTGTVPYVYKVNVSGNSISNNVSTATTGATDNIALESYVGSSAQAGSKLWVRENTVGNTTITAVSTAAYNCVTIGNNTFNNTAMDISKNTVTNITRNAATTGAFTGVANLFGAAVSVKLDSNTVSNISHTGATTGAFTAISNLGSTATTATYTAIRNQVSNCSHTGTGTMGLLNNGNAINYTITNNSITNNTKTSATTGILNCIIVTGSATLSTSVNVSDNTVSGNTATSTSIITLLDAGLAVTYQVNNNNVFNNIDNGVSGTMYCTRTQGAAGSTVNYTNNIVHDNSFPATSGATAAFLYGHYNIAAVGTAENYTGNHIYNLSMGGTNTAVTNRLIGLYTSTATASVKNISNNNVHDISANVTGAGAVLTYGIVSDLGAATSQIFKNRICGITSSTSGTTAAIANGLGLGAITTTAGNAIVFNNLIANIFAPNSASTDAIRGINISQVTASTAYGIYFNTVYLNATSTGANFGTSALYHVTSTSGTTSNLDMRNNILINTSTPTGTGVTAAYRRNANALGNYNNNSNNNIFYGGTPSPSRLIFYDGTNSDQNMTTYKTRVAPRDAGSQTENVAFISTTCGNAQFLHVNASTPTLVESGGSPVSGITDDFDSDVRNTGNPDIGADEGTFVSAALVITSATAAPGAQCTATSHVITAVIIPGSTAVASVSLNYAFNGTAQTAIVMTNTSGNNWTGTIPAATPANAIVTWSIVGTDASFSRTRAGISYQDAYLTGATTTATANPSTICAFSNSSLSVSALAGGPGLATVGTQTTTIGGNVGNPYRSGTTANADVKTEILVLASELQAAGLAAGNITSLSLNCTTAGGTVINFSIKMGHTSLTALTATYATTPTTTVFTQASFTPVVGTNTHVFSTPFNWDGVSNIVVTFCQTQSVTGTTTVTAWTPSYTPNNHTVGIGFCTALTGATVAAKPVMIFGGTVGVNFTNTMTWTWNPGAVIGNPIVVNPGTTTTYTATGVDGNGCTVTSNPVVVTVNPLPATPIANNNFQCGVGVPNCFVTGSGGLFSWYLVPTGGTAIPGESGTSLTTYSINTTTTFYVSENDGTCNSARVAVVQTVNQPDAVTASATPLSFCLNGSTTLNATQTGSTNIYTYSWTASPSSGSGISGSVPGSSVIVTPTVAGTYTYTVTAIDAGANCSNASTVVVTVIALPTAPVPTANPTNLCSGDTTQLNAGTFISGSGIVSTPTLVGNSSSAAGFDLTNTSAFPVTIHFLSFTSSAAAGTALTESVYYNTTPMNCVIPANVTTAPGWILIGSGSTTSAGTAPNLTTIPLDVNITVPAGSTYAFALGGASVAYSNGVGGCPIIASDPNIAIREGFGGTLTGTIASRSFNGSVTYSYLVGNPNLTYSWSPAASINNPNIINPKAGPSVTTTYVVTATDPTSTCSSSGSVVVTTNPLPPTPTGFNSSHCGSGVPNCAVTSIGGISRWYLTPTGGTPIAGETGTNLTTYTTSVTTTFYVSEFDGACESHRVAVVETVIPTDAVTASASPATVCPGGTVTLTATQNGSTSSYIYDWTANPATGSGINGVASGQVVTVTPTAGGTFTYTVTATDGGTSCVTSSTLVYTVTAPPLITSATASQSTICSGTSVTLTALTGTTVDDTAAIGTATTTATTVGINPLTPFWESSRSQYLIKASELTAQGLVAGNINGFAFKITAKTTLSYDWLNYTIKMAHTNVAALTTAFETPTFSTVFGPTTIPTAAVVIGYNGVALTTPFNWDGVSNIVVDICFNNDGTGTCAACYNPNLSLTFEYTATTFNSVCYRVVDDVSACGAAATTTTSLNRPNFLIFGQSGATGPGNYNWVWNPGNLSGNSVVVTPLTTTTYTVTATDPTSTCTSTASVVVNVNPTPSAPLLVGTGCTQCGYGVPSCAVTGTGGIFKWYLSPTGGTALAGETGGSLTSYSISTTTTFYVSETDGTCESARTAVVATVTPSDPVSINASPSSVCLSSSTTLTAVQSGSNNTYSYSWTATPSTGSGITGTVTGSSVVITPTVAGTYTYYLTANDVTLSCAALATITIVVKNRPTPPVPTANPSSVCPGDSSQLSAGTFVSGNGIVTTPLLVGNGSSAAGMDITNTSAFPITLHFFSFTSSATAGTALSESVYYNTTPMNCVVPANVTTAPGWVLIGTAATTSAGTAPNLTTIPLDVNITIPAGTTYAFALGGASVSYSNGVGGCPIIASDANIAVHEGFGGTLTGTIAQRSWNGSVTYSYLVGNPNLTYSWTPSGSLSNPNILNPKAAPAATTTYTVIATDPSTGCSSSGSVTVNTITSVGGAPAFTSSDDTICGSGPVTLTVTGPVAGLHYQWQRSTSSNPGTWIDFNTNTSATANISVNTYFRVYATCGSSSDTSTVKLVVDANPTILGTTNGNRCGAGPVTLTVSGTGNFTWWDSPTGGNQVGSGANYTASYGVTTTVYAQASIGSCTYAGGRIPATATINASPTASIVVSPDSSICEGTTLNFTASSSNSNYMYSWSTDGSTVLGTGTTFMHTPTANTIYYLLATDNVVASPFYGCGYQATKIVSVVANPPAPIVNNSNPSICTPGGSVTLTVTNPTSGIVYVWNPGNDTATSVTVSPTSTTTYCVTAVNFTTVGTNVALSAVCTSSGGGVSTAGYGPEILNDGLIPACDITGTFQWGWVTTSGSYTFTWSSQKTFSEIVFYKANRPFTTIALIEYSNDGGSTWFPIISGYTSNVTACTAGDPFSLVDSVSFPAVTGDVLRLSGIAGSSNPNFREIQVLSGSAAGGCSVSTCVNVVVDPITNPTITPSGSTTNICPGSSLSLDAGTGYATYSWSNGASVVGTSQVLSVNPMTTTTYTVTVSNGTVCTGSSSQVVTVQAIPTPVITTVGSVPFTFCSGSNIILDAGANYDSYSWSDGSSVIGNAQTQNVSSAGTYTVTVTKNGCTLTASATTSVNPSPPTAIASPAGPISLCSNGTNSPLTLTSDTSNAGAGASMIWNQDGNPSTTSINVNAGDIDLLLNGGTFGYYFQVTNSFGCSTNSNIVTVNEVPCSGPTLYAKLFLEGYYTSGIGNIMDNVYLPPIGGLLYHVGLSSDVEDVDYVTLSAMDENPPYGLIESQTGIIKRNGTIQVTFSSAVSNTGQYYIMVNHRNALETWSAAPVVIGATTSSARYDFTTAASKAYASYQADLGDGNWALYSGDISDAGTATVGIQDDIVESQDYGDMENAVFYTYLGYVPEDITGDGIVDSGDYGLMENNVYFTRVIHRP